MSLLDKIWTVFYGIAIILGIRVMIIGATITKIKLKNESRRQKRDRLRLGWAILLLGMFGFIFMGIQLFLMWQLWK